MNFPHSLVLMHRQYAHAGGALTKDAAGFPADDDAVETAFQGWLQPSPPQGRLRQGAGASDEEVGLAFSSHIIFAPPGLPAAKNDRVRREPDDGLRYRIEEDPADAAGMGHHLEIQASEYRFAQANA